MMRARGIAARLLLLFASLAVALALVEGALHLFFPDLGRPVTQVVRFAPGDRDFQYYDRKVVFVDGDVGYLHAPDRPEYTGFGIFGRDTPLSRTAAGEFRLLILGDSVGEWGSLLADGFAHVIARALADNDRGRRVVALNASHAGYGIGHIRAWLETYGDRVEPDLVLYAFVNNDLSAPLPERFSRADDGALELRFATPEPVPLIVDFGPMNPLLLDRLRALPLLFRTVGPALESRGITAPLPRRDPMLPLALAQFDRITAFCRARRLPLAVAHFPVGTAWDAYERLPEARTHREIARYCAARGIPYHDLLPAFSARDFRDLFVEEEWHGDGPAYHPNETGHRLAGYEIARFLAREGLAPFRVRDAALLDPPEPPGDMPPFPRIPPGDGPPGDGAFPGSGDGGPARGAPGEAPAILPLKLGGATLRVAALPADRNPAGWLEMAQLLDTAEATVGGAALRLRPGLLFLHESGALLSAIPDDTVEATVGGVPARFAPGEPLDFHPDGAPLAGTLADPLPQAGGTGAPLPAGTHAIFTAAGEAARELMEAAPAFIRVVETAAGRVAFAAFGYTGHRPADPATGAPPRLMRLESGEATLDGRPFAYPARSWFDMPTKE